MGLRRFERIKKVSRPRNRGKNATRKIETFSMTKQKCLLQEKRRALPLSSLAAWLGWPPFSPQISLLISIKIVSIDIIFSQVLIAFDK